MIAKRAGWLCSFPTCRTPTVGATLDGEGVIDIGTAAHICAAAPGGPRYDDKQSPEERSAAQNGIWMCRDHGKAIDSSDSEFTVEQLHRWKREAEFESRQRVLRNETSSGPTVITDEDLAARIRLASRADFKVFRETTKWPSTSVALTLRVDGFDEPVTTSALADAARSLDDLILVAPPGMGKTTTLFQIAEGMLESGNGTPFVIPLCDWATENSTILESLLKRPACRKISEDDLRKAAAQPGIVLLLDGWNELDAPARNRARVQVTALKAQLPEIGFVISTRKQALDVPFEGMHIDLLPLNENQQLQIATAMRGEHGVKILDHAWRTDGVSELVSIPLYLTTLLSLPENSPFPTTKEEVLRHFVAAHENEASRAEALLNGVQGLQKEYLEGLAVFATNSANAAIVDKDARRSVFDTENMLGNAGQITIKPQPDAVLDVLVSNHVLVRSGESASYSFQHQQFQEWYASYEVERRIIANVNNPTGVEALKAEIFNFAIWEEAILFAVERLAHSGRDHKIACGNAILAALLVDPMLAAEMIFRSTEDVWMQIATIVQDLVERWHTPGKVDRALRFMLTSGRADFIEKVWPQITNDNEQLSFAALRNCGRFRPSILGKDAVKRIVALPKQARIVLLDEIASHSGIDGLELVSAIAANDPDPELQATIAETLAFRHAERHVAKVMENASPTTFDLVVPKGMLDDVQDENIQAGMLAARKRLAAKKTSVHGRLNVILNARATQDHRAELIDIISTIQIDELKDSGVHLIQKARSRDPNAVSDGLLARVRLGHTMFVGADDILASTGIILEDEDLLELALHNPAAQDKRAEAAASVLGPKSVGHLVDAALEVSSRLRTGDQYSRESCELLAGLKTRIAHVPGTSLAAAILARSAETDNEKIALMASLLSGHPDSETAHGRPFDVAALTAIQELVNEWGNRLLLSRDAKRWQTAKVAILASTAPSPNLLTILKQLLDDNLKRYQAFIEQAQAVNWQYSEAVNEARIPYTGEYQRAFMAIQVPETASLMKEYLADEHFGELAAQVLANHWRAMNEPVSDKRLFGGVDFSVIQQKRTARILDPNETTEEAEFIFAAIESLIANNATDQQTRLAVALGTVAVRLPHGQRDSLISKLIAYASRRARPALLLNLILSGEEIDVKLISDGIAETFDAAKTQPWVLTQGDGYELRLWLQLLPFVRTPTKGLDIVRDMPPAQREPHFLEGMVAGLANVPSPETEEFLFGLAQDDDRFYSNYLWRTTALRFGTSSSACRIIDLTASGKFPIDVVGSWQLAQGIGSLIEKHPKLRDHLYRLLNDGPTTPGLATLARVVADNPDEEGLLMLIRFEKDHNLRLVGAQAVERVITKRVPVDEWPDAYNVIPIHATGLRKRLFEQVRDAGPADAAARCLRLIDLYRDKYGVPESEPRHPDLMSGRPWPIMLRDPDDADSLI